MVVVVAVVVVMVVGVDVAISGIFRGWVPQAVEHVFSGGWWVVYGVIELPDKKQRPTVTDHAHAHGGLCYKKTPGVTHIHLDAPRRRIYCHGSVGPLSRLHCGRVCLDTPQHALRDAHGPVPTHTVQGSYAANRERVGGAAAAPNTTAQPRQFDTRDHAVPERACHWHVVRCHVPAALSQRT